MPNYLRARAQFYPMFAFARAAVVTEGNAT